MRTKIDELVLPDPMEFCRAHINCIAAKLEDLDPYPEKMMEAPGDA